MANTMIGRSVSMQSEIAVASITFQPWLSASRLLTVLNMRVFFFFQAEDGIRDSSVTGVQTCALPISPRDLAAAITADAQQGAHVFEAIGCGVCHVSTIVTAPANTLINGGTLTVPEALGNKIIHPFGDFLLHDVGTGDGIVQNGGQETATKLRTAPLWGVRMRNRLMHDGNSLTFENAIERHKNEADDASDNFRRLTPRQRNALIAFLHSL